MTSIPKSPLFDSYAAVGELSLEGLMRPVKGALSMAISAARQDGLEGLVVPARSAEEAAVRPQATQWSMSTTLCQQCQAAVSLLTASLTTVCHPSCGASLVTLDPVITIHASRTESLQIAR